MSQPLKIFISYARKDANYKDDLLVHLSPLKRNGLIEAWHDSDVEPGEVWESEILNQLQEADVILFLVSPNFMASEYIHREEIQRAMERHKQGKTIIVPIWIKPVAVSDAELDRFQSLPKDRKPVSQWGDRDEAWVDVVQRLLPLFKKLSEQKADTKSPAAEAPKGKSALDKNNIRNLIANDKIRDALQTLLDYTEHNDADNHNALTMLMARFNKLKRDEGMGILSTGDAQLERNRINAALLGILGDL